VKETPPKVFEFVTTSEDAINLSQVMKDMRSDMDELRVEKREQESMLKYLIKSINDNKDKLEKSKGIGQILKEINLLHPKNQELEGLKSLLVDIEVHRDRALKSREEYKSISPILNISTLVIDEVIEGRRELSSQLDFAYFSSKKAEDLDSRLGNIEGILNAFDKMESLENIERAREHITKLDLCVEMANKAYNRMQAISKDITDIERLGDYGDLGRQLGSLEILSELCLDIENSRNALLGIKKEYTQIGLELKEIRDELLEYKNCPLCGHPLEEV